MKIIELSPSNPSVKRLPQAWALFLDNPNYHWYWYGHFTFRGYPHLEAGNKIFRKFINMLNYACEGRNFWKRPEKCVTWVRSTEYQSRGSLHYHSIIGNITAPLNRFQYMDIWHELAGYARIYHYEKDRGAEFYLSKSSYAWKQGEIDVSDTLQYHSDQGCL